MSESTTSGRIQSLEHFDPAVGIALQQLCAAYWFCADQWSEGIGELFMEDGTLTLGSLVLTGRAAIEKFFRERAASMRTSGRTTRHAAGNFLVTAVEDERATVRSTVLVFSGTGARPLPAAAPSGIADFTDVCVRDASGRWQFASRVGRTVFIGTEAPSFAR
jgi:hypothetical protein